MAHTKRTLALSGDWDLVLNNSGNLALKEGAAATAQNAANEVRLWTKDAYFQQDRGIEWAEVQLALKLDESTLEQVVREAALRVDDVAAVESVRVEDVDPAARKLTGTITIRTAEEGIASQDF